MPNHMEDCYLVDYEIVRNEVYIGKFGHTGRYHQHVTASSAHRLAYVVNDWPSRRKVMRVDTHGWHVWVWRKGNKEV